MHVVLAIVVIFVCSEVFLRSYSDANSSRAQNFIPQVEPTSPTRLLSQLHKARQNATLNPRRWLNFLRSHSQNGSQTTRLGCREYAVGAQSCAYEGFVCINTSKHLEFGRPHVYFLDETEEDGEVVPSDNWCGYRHQSADPRYYGSRHWPIMNGTVAPQNSCLDAYYRKESSLVGGRLKSDPSGRTGKIKWMPSLWLVDLDYVNNNHNNHLLMDIIWMLDAALWQQSVDLQAPPGISPVERVPVGQLFTERPRHVYLPQGRQDFIQQTSRDVNRLLYALVLQLDLSRLYPNHTKVQIQNPPRKGNSRFTESLLDAYPHLEKDQGLLFHRDIRDDDDVDLVCTPRFSAGAKIHNGAHERVCRVMRQRSYQLFGIKEPEMKRAGQAYFPQPPKRVVILQRHITRGIANADELAESLRDTLGKHGVEVEVIATEEVSSAEEHVRVFSNAGVVLTSHGSQSMGQIWMPRHRYVKHFLALGSYLASLFSSCFAVFSNDIVISSH